MKKIFCVLAAVLCMSGMIAFCSCDTVSDGGTASGGTNIGENGNDGKDDNGNKFTGITFPSKELTYDGEEHAVLIEGELPDGAQVSYTQNKGVNAGIYRATATVSGENYETLTLETVLTISKAEFTGVELNGKTFVATGSEKSLSVEGDIPPGTEISYKNNFISAAGVYNVEADRKSVV